MAVVRFDPLKKGAVRLIEVEIGMDAADVSVNFYNDVQTEILCHIGLRPGKNQVAFNYLIDGEWGQETALDITLHKGGRAFFIVWWWDTHAEIALPDQARHSFQLPAGKSVGDIFFVQSDQGAQTKPPLMDPLLACDMLVNAGLGGAQWLVGFDHLGYQAANPGLEGFSDAYSALVHFVEKGRFNGCLVRPDLFFSPDFYRTTFKDMENATDADAVWHFLTAGYYEGRDLRPRRRPVMLGLMREDRARLFDPWLLHNGRGSSSGKPMLLVDFAKALLDPAVPTQKLPFSKKQMGRQLAAALLKEALIAEKNQLAARLIAYLIFISELSDDLADAALRADITYDYGCDVRAYVDARLDDGVFSHTALLVGAERLIDAGQEQGASRLLGGLHAPDHATALKRDRCLIQLRQGWLDAARARAITALPDQGRETAIEIMQEALRSDVGRPRFYEAALKSQAHMRLPDTGDLSVLIVGPSTIPQCKTYRIDQKIILLEAAGCSVDFLDEAALLEDPIAARPYLPDTDILIAYRTPLSAALEYLLVQARLAGILVILEQDDQIFDGRSFPADLGDYCGQISAGDHAGLAVDTARFSAVIPMVQRGLASTDTLKDQLIDLAGDAQDRDAQAREIPVDVLPNMLETTLAQRPQQGVDRLLKARQARSDVRIFYGSGTMAHSRDFDLIAAAGLSGILDRYPNAHLVLAGPVKLPKALEPYLDQISRLPFTHDRDAYMAHLASADIALAPLRLTPATNAKSAIKWLEAAAFGVPLVASAIPAMATAIEDGVSGMLAATTSTFGQKLEELVSNPALRQSMGRAAHASAHEKYGQQAAKIAIDTLVKDWLGAFLDAPDKIALIAAPGVLTAHQKALYASGLIHGYAPFATRLARRSLCIAADERDILAFAASPHAARPYRLLLEAEAVKGLTRTPEQVMRSAQEDSMASLKTYGDALSVIERAEQIAIRPGAAEASLSMLGLEATCIQGPDDLVDWMAQ